MDRQATDKIKFNNIYGLVSRHTQFGYVCKTIILAKNILVVAKQLVEKLVSSSLVEKLEIKNYLVPN